MDDRIKPDFSVRFNFGGQDVFINRMYDHVHIYSWLGHGILKVIGEEGFQQWHVGEASARQVAEAAGIVPIERTEISEKEYQGYLNAMILFMEEGEQWDIPES
jgi:hypothetical protein